MNVNHSQILLDSAVAALNSGNSLLGASYLYELWKHDPSILKSDAIRISHLLTIGGYWDAITSLLPKGTNSLVETGWLNSLTTSRPVNAANQPIPWYTYPSIEFIEPKVKREWNVFEWGSGNSTLWWSQRVNRVISVDHDPEWFRSISNQMPDNVSIKLITEKTSYIQALEQSVSETNGALLDVIVIDGEWRNECAKQAINFLSPEGVIIFDNTDRIMFREGTAHLDTCGLFRIDFYGMIASYLYKNCTSVFMNTPAFLRSGALPSDHRTSLGPTCSQALGE